MGWQDAPVVETPAWQQAPEIADPYAGQSMGQKFLGDARLAGQGIKRAADLAVKGVNDAVVGTAAIPLNIAADLTNRIAGTSLPIAGQEWQKYSDSSIAPPTSIPESLIKEGAGFAAGSKVPVPGMQDVPATAPSRLSQSAAQARQAGYVVPESMAGGGGLSKFMEMLAGKKQLAAEATARNIPQVSENLGKEFNLPAGTEMSHETLDAVRTEANKAYDKVSSLSPTYAALVDQIKSLRSQAQGKYRQISANYNHDVAQQADDLWQKAQEADAVLGGALKSQGDEALFSDYQTARQTIAKTHEVEKALVESRGEVKPGSFAKSYEKGKPLTGELETAGQSAQAFPAAFNTKPTAGAANIDNWLLGSGAGAWELTHRPGLALAVAASGLARKGARAFMLSKAMQNPAPLTAAEKQQAFVESLLRGGAASPNSTEQ